jgi:hypothetical protein
MVMRLLHAEQSDDHPWPTKTLSSELRLAQGKKLCTLANELYPFSRYRP